MRRCIATSVAITDPLVKYHSLLSTGVYAPDPAQHRLARHLQKIYLRLRDYEPAPDFGFKITQVEQAIRRARENASDRLAVEGHPLRQNPLFSRFFQETEGSSGSLALTKVLSSHQAAAEVNSPKGLFLSGEVGTGKSMLLDLLADGLPPGRKKRWHFNTFMLYAFSRMEEFRKQSMQDDHGYSLLWMAREMIEKSPILFLDEFQLPDRTASKLLTNLFVLFFQLGGVLVASSNRMPEELEKAVGVQYCPPPPGSLFRQVLRLGQSRPAGQHHSQTGDFAAFLDVIKARCDFWHMEGARDWRRRDEGEPDSPSPIRGPSGITRADLPYSDDGDGTPAQTEAERSPQQDSRRPAKYFLPGDSDESWESAIRSSRSVDSGQISWTESHLVVYGRKLSIPRQHNGVSHWRFKHLVSSLGPADYLSLASNYHTFIVDEVPILTLACKNEARRYITFLDALYEARCKLIVRAEAGPDDLFFPERRGSPVEVGEHVDSEVGRHREDATYSETVAEIFQDQVSPFRPNISMYEESPKSPYDPQQQESGFGAAGHKVDFTANGTFTGEDERFAYKRASSRLWELCSSGWHARTGDWWQPLPTEARHWEGTKPSEPPVR